MAKRCKREKARAARPAGLSRAVWYQRLTDIVDMLPDPTFAIDNEQRIIIWNRAMEELSGIPADAALGRTDYIYSQAFYGEKRPILINMVSRSDDEVHSFYPTAVREGEIWTVELQLKVRPGGSYHHAKARILRDSRGRVTGAIETVRDITDRKRAEEALAVRLRQEEFLATCSRMLLTDTGEDGENDALGPALDSLRHVLSSARAYLTRNVEDPLVGRRMIRTHEASAPWVVPMCNALKTVCPAYADGLERWERELSHDETIAGNIKDLPNNEQRHLELIRSSAVLMRPLWVQGEWYGFVGVDDSVARRWSDEDERLLDAAAEIFARFLERQRANRKVIEYQNKLSSLASELALTEERERRKIATALHDRINQSLIGTVYTLELLREESDCEQLREHMGEVLDQIGRIATDTRSLTFEICPPMLYDLGLGAALSWLAEQIENQHHITCVFGEQGGQQELSSDLRGLLFQAGRELVTNAVKHAQAGHIFVTLRHSDSELVIAVEDDGVGISRERLRQAISAAGGFGLFSMRERLRYFNGTLTIADRPGGGSAVEVRVPLHRDRGGGEKDGD